MNRAWKQRNGAKIRLAARRAKKIRDGIKESFDTDAIIADFTAMGFATLTPEQARSWTRTHVRTNNQALSAALFGIYVEAYVLGQDIANSIIENAPIRKITKAEAKTKKINWRNWRPGNKPAALLLRKPKGLQTLLDRRDIVIQGINQTTLDRLGTILARGVIDGLTPQQLKRQVARLIDADSSRALTIAQTETSRAVTAASRELYEESDVEMVEWLVAEPCDICQENADASPISIGSIFPSGDTEPPAHPNCVCDLAPYVVATKRGA